MMNLSNYIDTRFPEHKDKIYEFLRFLHSGHHSRRNTLWHLLPAADVHRSKYSVHRGIFNEPGVQLLPYIVHHLPPFAFGQESRRIRTEPSGELLAAHIPVQRILADRRATTHCPYLCTDDSRTYQLHTAAMGV